jgi:hypothetical protein
MSGYLLGSHVLMWRVHGVVLEAATAFSSTCLAAKPSYAYLWLMDDRLGHRVFWQSLFYPIVSWKLEWPKVTSLGCEPIEG